MRLRRFVSAQFFPIDPQQECERKIAAQGAPSTETRKIAKIRISQKLELRRFESALLCRGPIPSARSDTTLSSLYISFKE